MKIMKRKFFFKKSKLHDNPVVDMILRKEEDGLCEKAAGLATVFQIVTDMDIAMLYSHDGNVPDCLSDKNKTIAKMGDILYKAVLKKFPLDLDITKSTYLWEVNADIVNKSGNKVRAIRQLASLYSMLNPDVAARIIKSHENIENDTRILIRNIIQRQYELHYQGH